MKPILLPTILLLSVVCALAQSDRRGGPSSGTGERNLMHELLSTTTTEQRRALLEKNGQYVTNGFFERVGDEGIRLCDKSEYERCEKLVDAGRHIAELSGDATKKAVARRYVGEMYLKKGEPSKA